VEDLEISTALTSNIEKRPLVFFHCVITDLLSTFFRLTQIVSVLIIIAIYW
jgi:hypothetical protein